MNEAINKMEAFPRNYRAGVARSPTGSGGAIGTITSVLALIAGIPIVLGR